MCQAFNCLPRAGGLFDQTFIHVMGMYYVRIAQDERQAKTIAEKRAEMEANNPTR